MPTVHLSISDQMYSELKNKSDEIGIQITDLIKLYIKTGLQGGFSNKNEDNIIIANISNRLDKVEKDVRVKMTLLEGKYRQIEETMDYLIQRIDSLEDLLTEYKTKRKVIQQSEEQEA
ncbi:MAG: hypothetical protein C0172_01810 [Caldisphaera sp.]|uniref:hypothetical protein n=1 Tax=Caldisphaera sp. TaxID=2060322 RepID=UPI000CB54D4F|nr:hypothetical protein [Caldisphaera sp.]PMP88788.1 MAG: hypothetical protein C0172_01810 [Caldisphaera sp.]